MHALQEQDHHKILQLESGVESLKGNLMKVLIPIRQNSEDIDLLDDDLHRIQRLVDELKKRKEELPPPSASV